MLRDTQLAILEATESHGATTFIGYDAIPANLKAMLIDAAKRKGWNEERLKAEWDGTNDPHPGANDKTDFAHGGVIDDMIHIALEDYHKERDQKVLLAENIVATYNAMASVHMDELDQKITNIEEYVKSKQGVKAPGAIETEEAFMKLNQNLLVYDHMCRAVRQFDKRYSEFTGYYAHNENVDFDAMAKQMILTTGYQANSDPKQIHQALQARVDYCNMVCATLRSIVTLNYDLLGYTRDEAMLLARGLEENSSDENRSLSIKSIKRHLKDNEKEFKTRYGFDFTKLGAGKFYVTASKTGFEDTETIDRIIQHCIEYDTVVSCHGGYDYGKDKTVAQDIRRISDRASLQTLDTNMYIENMNQEFVIKGISLLSELKILWDDNEDMITALNDSIENIKAKETLTESDKKRLEKQQAALKMYRTHQRSLQNFFDHHPDPNKNPSDAITIFKYIIGYREHYPDSLLTASTYNEAKKIMNEYEKYDKKTKDATKIKTQANRAGNERLKRANKNLVWTCQVISTEHGSFTDVNELLRSLIAHGSKNIYLSMCNPGHANLDPDIKKIKGVHVHYAKNALMVEDAEDYCFDSAEEYLNEAQLLLESYGGVAEDDFFLDLDDYVLADENALLEAITVATMWSYVKSSVKKAIEFMKTLFSRVIDFFRRVIQRIKDWFKNRKGITTKTSEPLEMTQIIVEDAHSDKTSVSSLAEIERQSTRACESLTKKLVDMEKEQLRAMDELNKFVESKATAISESSNINMESLMNMII